MSTIYILKNTHGTRKGVESRKKGRKRTKVPKVGPVRIMPKRNLEIGESTYTLYRDEIEDLIKEGLISVERRVGKDAKKIDPELNKDIAPKKVDIPKEEAVSEKEVDLKKEASPKKEAAPEKEEAISKVASTEVKKSKGKKRSKKKIKSLKEIK